MPSVPVPLVLIPTVTSAVVATDKVAVSVKEDPASSSILVAEEDNIKSFYIESIQ